VVRSQGEEDVRNFTASTISLWHSRDALNAGQLAKI